jgi:hypothetical protein
MKKAPVPLFKLTRYTSAVSQKHGHDSMNTQGWIGAKSCLITTDRGASVKIAIPAIIARMPKRGLTTPYALQKASGQLLPILKEPLVTMTLEQHPLTTWASVAKITHKFILGLDIMHAHDASVDLRCHVLWLGDEVPLWQPGARLCSTPCMKGSSDVAAARCVTVTAVRLEGPPEAVHSLAGTGSRASNHAEVRMPVQSPIERAADDEKRSPAAEAHSGRCTLKRTMALESQLLQIW